MALSPPAVAREPAAESCAHATVMQPKKYNVLLLGFTMFHNILDVLMIIPKA